MINNLPKITVWTSIYNREKTVGRCIESVINQTIKPLEYIILDDCSTDDSFEIATEYAKKYSWIKVFRNERNLGPFKNWNQIINYANGDYLYDVGDDDYSSPNTIELFQKALLKWPSAKLISGQIEVVDKNGYTLSTEKVKKWTSMDFHSPNDCLNNYLLIEPAHHSLSAASLLARSSFQYLGGYRNELGHWADTFNIRYIALKHGMVYLPEILHYWTDSPDTISGRDLSDSKKSLLIVKKASSLMRNNQFSTVFPEEYVSYFEQGYKKLIYNPIIGDYEYHILMRNNKFYSNFRRRNLKNKLICKMYSVFIKFENFLFTSRLRSIIKELEIYYNSR